MEYSDPKYDIDELLMPKKASLRDFYKPLGLKSSNKTKSALDASF